MEQRSSEVLAPQPAHLQGWAEVEASRDPAHAAALPRTAPLLTRVEATAEAVVSASTDPGKQELLEAEAASASTDLGKQVLQEAEAASAWGLVELLRKALQLLATHRHQRQRHLPLAAPPGSTEAAPAPALPQDHLRTRPPWATKY